MTDSDSEFLMFAVKLLFERIKEGKVKFVAEKVPATIKALDAVRFDETGNPILETITPPVRALANAMYTMEVDRLKDEAIEREKKSPVRDLLGKPTEVNNEVICACVERGTFSPVAFELYKETGVVLAVCSNCYSGEEPGKGSLSRNQAVCAGLLVRISKFMLAVIQLISTANRGEVVMALNRSILESATNLRFLLLKGENTLFDDFIHSSFGPERELYDIVQENIKHRGGDALPIEKRILKSIGRACKLSKVRIENIDPKLKNWGGGLKTRLKALGEEELYLGMQRIPSHAVHGTWMDLVLHHLQEKDGGLVPNPDWCPVDSRLLCPPCPMILDSARIYLQVFFSELPELKPLFQRIDDLEQRIKKLDDAHEQWLDERDNGKEVKQDPSRS
jgi:hypothetical protein